MIRRTRGRPRQIADSTIFRAIKAYIGEYHISPSVRDLVQRCGATSTAQIWTGLVSLQRRGLIGRVPGVPRSIYLIERERTED